MPLKKSRKIIKKKNLINLIRKYVGKPKDLIGKIQNID